MGPPAASPLNRGEDKAMTEKILWEQTRCRLCKHYPDCPRNGDIRGVYVEHFFAEKCALFGRKPPIEVEA